MSAATLSPRASGGFGYSLPGIAVRLGSALERWGRRHARMHVSADDALHAQALRSAAESAIAENDATMNRGTFPLL